MRGSQNDAAWAGQGVLPNLAASGVAAHSGLWGYSIKRTGWALERHLDEGELQLIEAGAPVSDLHCHIAALLALLCCHAGMQLSMPSLHHQAAFECHRR